MAIIQGATTSALTEVDPTFKAIRTAIRPIEVTAWTSIGAQTGAITGTAAGAAVFSLRNLSSNLIIVRRIGVGFMLTTAFTTAQVVDFGVQMARSFTASDTGGTTITVSGTTNGKRRTSLNNPTSLDCRIATTAALTAGTKTLDSNTISQLAGWGGAVGNIITPAIDNLLGHAADDYSIVLAINEGLNIVMPTALGANGVGRAYVNIELAEAASY